MLTVNHLLGFLENEGWTQTRSNANYIFYKPPDEMGFAENFDLPIVSPKTVDQTNHQRVLNETLDVLSKIYEQDITKMLFDIESYLDVLKESALYFKLESNEIVFERTLEISHIWTFLKNLSSSYFGYLRYKFSKDFEVNDDPLLNYQKSLNYVLRYSKLRLIDLEYQSFSFGVATDVVMGNDKIGVKEISSWRKEIIPSFEKDVVDVDFNSIKAVDGLLDKYEAQERKDIFSPLLRAVSNESVAVMKTDNTYSRKKRIKRPPQSTIDKMIEAPVEAEEKKDITMYQIVIPIDKAKSKITINTASIENDLFSKEATQINWKIPTVAFGNQELFFDPQLEITITLDQETSDFNVEFEELNIRITTDEFNKIGNELFAQIMEKYLVYSDIIARKDIADLSEEQENIKAFFDNNLEKDKDEEEE